jgi:hypothetical protein
MVPGQLFEVDRVPTEFEPLIADGSLRVIRDPDAKLELPERPETDLEKAAAVPRLCRSGVAVCLGGGPSLTAADVDACRGKATVIAINDAYRLAPWADVLYAADAKWWRWHAGVPTFPGRKYAIRNLDMAFPDDADIHILENSGEVGLETSPLGLRSGKDSGYQAINLAVHLGATKILLLGYDGQYPLGGPAHWFGEHPDGSRLDLGVTLPLYDTLVVPLKRLGVTVVNCSRETSLLTFPRQPLAEALPKKGRRAA